MGYILRVAKDPAETIYYGKRIHEFVFLHFCLSHHKMIQQNEVACMDLVIKFPLKTRYNIIEQHLQTRKRHHSSEIETPPTKRQRLR